MAISPSEVAQQETLLSTKLSIPQVRLDSVPRGRLLDQLNEGFDRKLTLVSAPPGSGKTTLLTEWSAQNESPVAWLSLDTGDNELRRFLAHFLGALQRIETGFEGQALAFLQSSQPQSAQAVLVGFINEIGAKLEPFALVLDDYHEIDNQAIHNAVAYLLDHLPPQMHLVIASRVDPPLPLSALRARGELIEIRPADLRFTDEEIAILLNQVLGLGLSESDLSALEARTEGWIAGLQLAALSMQSEVDIPGFIKSFTGSHRHVFDYLADEVLSRQPEPIQSFLLGTCVLERMTGALCDAVTKRDGGQVTLERLEIENLFVVALDNERIWYRYHHLFADFLRERLRKANPDRLPGLHRRASDWLEAQGLEREAIRHAFAAGETDTAARLIEQVAQSMWAGGEVSTLLALLEALPEETMLARPRLSLSRAFALMQTGRLDQAENAVQDFESGVGEIVSASQVEALKGQATAVRAIVACYRGDSPLALALSHEALENIPEDSLELRAVLSLNIAMNPVGGYSTAEDLKLASRFLTEAVNRGESVGDIRSALPAISYLAPLQVYLGRLHEAAETSQRALSLARSKGGPLFPIGAVANVVMGALNWEWNHLEEAEQSLKAGIELAESGGDLNTVLGGYQSLARVRDAQHDHDGAIELLQHAEDIAVRANMPPAVRQVVALRARLQNKRGKYAVARAWVKAENLPVGGALSYTRVNEYTTLARVLISEASSLHNSERLEEAAELLKWVLELTQRAGLMGFEIEVLSLQALVYERMGKGDSALSGLERALKLGEPEGYVRTFVDEGEPMGVLLRRAAAKGIAVEYVSKLLATLETEGNGELHTPHGVEPLIEPLTSRELEVLRLMAAGLKNREIAEELVVVVGTVKAHIGSIYGKMDVSNRVQAISRGKELGLL